MRSIDIPTIADDEDKEVYENYTITQKDRTCRSPIKRKVFTNCNFAHQKLLASFSSCVFTGCSFKQSNLGCATFESCVGVVVIELVNFDIVMFENGFVSVGCKPTVHIKDLNSTMSITDLYDNAGISISADEADYLYTVLCAVCNEIIPAIPVINKL